MDQLKKIVLDKYALVADQNKDKNQSSCCGSSGCFQETDYSVFSDDYSQQTGYVPEADLGLGCGIPTDYAKIKKGDTVIDLGSGAGNDCFVARSLVGEEGMVIGIDMTPEMIEKARENNKKMGFRNVKFRPGDIEKLPVTSNKADVVISNCVLNLVPDKKKAFSEIFRVLKPGGHFSISDVVVRGGLPAKIREAAEMYAGCVAGAMDRTAYLEVIENTGFRNIRVQKEKTIHLPGNVLLNHMSPTETEEFINSGIGIFSITIYAEKPACLCSDC